VAISVTGRFRDPHQYDFLRGTVLPELTAATTNLRVWSAGCSNGLEVLGVAALLEELDALDKAHLLGSDLLEENIDAARGSGLQAISSRVASRTRWEVRDLTSDGAPDARFDLILCRNVGIYFAPDARLRLMDLLAGALNRNGILLLGRSERITDPAAHGLVAYGPNAYRRPA
jgi:chemotaxis protein methyltransferase CheR